MGEAHVNEFLKTFCQGYTLDSKELDTSFLAFFTDQPFNLDNGVSSTNCMDERTRLTSEEDLASQGVGAPSQGVGAPSQEAKDEKCRSTSQDACCSISSSQEMPTRLNHATGAALTQEPTNEIICSPDTYNSNINVVSADPGTSCSSSMAESTTDIRQKKDTFQNGHISRESSSSVDSFTFIDYSASLNRGAGKISCDKDLHVDSYVCAGPAGLDTRSHDQQVPETGPGDIETWSHDLMGCLDYRWTGLNSAIEERLQQLSDAMRDFGPSSQHILTSK